jgi:uncharacterized protein
MQLLFWFGLAAALGAPSPPGAAFFGFRSAGVTVVAPDGAFSKLQGAPEWIRDIERCGASLWVITANDGETFAVRDGQMEHVDFSNFQHKPVKFACASDGSSWAHTSFGVVHHHDGTWDYQPREAVDAQAKLFEDIAIDSRGDLWLYDRGNVVYRGDGTTWERVPIPLIEGELPKLRAVAAAGRQVFLVHSSGVFARTGTGWDPFPIDKLGYHRGVATSPKGTLFVASARTVYALAPRAPEPEVVLEVEGVIDSIGVDGRGRLWVAHQGEMEVIDPDGTTTRWPRGAFPLMVGQVDQMFFDGAGPTLPDVPEPVTGTVTGFVEHEGARGAGIVVAACVSPALVGFKIHPCEADPDAVTATSGGQGGFSLPGLASGTVYLAVGRGKQWTMNQHRVVFERKGQGASVGSVESPVAPLQGAGLDACHRDKDAEACMGLGRALQSGGDLAGAQDALTKACDAGAWKGCFEAAFLPLRHEGLEKDFPSIVSLFGRACDLGEPTGCQNAGVIPYQGLYGAPVNKTGTRAWFRKGCDLDNGASCALLAYMSLKGEDGPKGDPEPLPLFQKSCDLGEEKLGCENLEKLRKASAPKTTIKTTVQVASLTVDGVRVTALDCKLDGGGMLASMGIVAALAKERTELLGCDGDGGAYTLSWTWDGGGVAAPEVGGGTAEQNRCVAQALTGASGKFVGACSATLHLPAAP